MKGYAESGLRVGPAKVLRAELFRRRQDSAQIMKDYAIFQEMPFIVNIKSML